MILSEKYKFIFVHIPKTAGMSVTDAFGKYGRPRNRSFLRSLSRRFPNVEPSSKAHFRVHDPASFMSSKLTRPVFDEFLSFSVIRNPYDHAVSHYEYMKQFRIKQTAKKVGQMNFLDYLRYRQQKPFGRDTIFARLPNQCYYLKESTGAFLVRRLIRFENLTTELELLAKELQLPDFQLKHTNKTKSRSDKRQFLDYYDSETEKLVRQIYAEDFEKLGYSTSL